MPNCMADDGQAAVFVGTFLTNGESVALCDEHMVYFCASTLQDMTGVDPAPFIAAISEEAPAPPIDLDTEIEDADAGFDPLPPPDPTPATPPRGRLRAVSSGAPTAGAGKSDTTTAEADATTSAG